MFVEIPVEALRNSALKVEIELQIKFLNKPHLKGLEEHFAPSKETRPRVTPVVDLVSVQNSKIARAVKL